MRGRGIETVGVFVLPPSAGVLEQRLRGRSKDSEEQVAARRLEVARAEVGELRAYDYVVVNDDHRRRPVTGMRADRAGRTGAA